MECSHFIVTRDRRFDDNEFFAKWYYDVMSQYDEFTNLNDRLHMLYTKFIEEGRKMYASDDPGETVKAGLVYRLIEK